MTHRYMLRYSRALTVGFGGRLRVPSQSEFHCFFDVGLYTKHVGRSLSGTQLTPDGEVRSHTFRNAAHSLTAHRLGLAHVMQRNMSVGEMPYSGFNQSP